MYTIEAIKNLVAKINLSLEEKVNYLGELDGKSGDGDLGLSIQAAFKAMESASQEFSGNDIGILLQTMAKACNKAAPSTMGTLIASGILGIAKSQIGKEELSDDEIIRFPRIFTDAIVARGKAKMGDKTILDALVPMCNAAETTYSRTGDLRESFQDGAEAAEKAAEATRGMQARIGRAKWLGERAAEYPDAGAVLCSILARSIL
jgi:dihydroxyacetone kinase-like protein